MRVLVTGGAGYIGSHAIIELLQSGNEVYVIDNFSNGHEEVLRRVSQLCDQECSFFNGDIRNTEDLNVAFSSFKPQAVMHFAGLIRVDESVKFPKKKAV